ncbi:recombinase family protein [Candidatus Obscuribacterales bacterium]|nr:recombinase family protein [Candidatus Obscuribacterales bacterium]
MVHRVAIYARVSTDEQSCDRQVAELQQYASVAGCLQLEFDRGWLDVAIGGRLDGSGEI